MQSHTYNKTEKGYKTGRDWGIIVPEKTLWANYTKTKITEMNKNKLYVILRETN